MMRLTPKRLNAQMLALTLRSVGRMVCSFPCLGRKATVLPPSSPTVRASEGLP
mgnify:CR=1 FL=1